MIQVASCAASKNLSSCCRSRARTQKIGNQSAKTAQRHRRERQHRRRVISAFTRVRPSWSRSRFVPFASGQNRPATHAGEQEQQNFLARKSIAFWAVADSRRWNRFHDARQRDDAAEQQNNLPERRAQFAPSDGAPAAQESTGEKIFRQRIDRQHGLEHRDQHHRAECPIAPVSSAPPATVPDSIASDSVPPSTGRSPAPPASKNAATGNDRKPAAASPSAASSAIQPG